ncbi:hypothetical protein HDV00_006071 [Rhizophlyctis rosea]|nr:hypothetical protein HDV00_006071 [Rhizophlyctis rosea]
MKKKPTPNPPPPQPLRKFPFHNINLTISGTFGTYLPELPHPLQIISPNLRFPQTLPSPENHLIIHATNNESLIVTISDVTSSSWTRNFILKLFVPDSPIPTLQQTLQALNETSPSHH